MYWLFTIADIAILGVFTFACLKSFRFLRMTEHERDKEQRIVELESKRAELPMGWISWLIYSIFLAIRVTLLFLDVVQHLDEADFFGPNTLKTTVAAAGIIFLLLVSTHHDAPHGSSRLAFIKGVAHGSTMDILDTTAILEILFVQDSHVFLTFEMHKTIIAIAFVNLILPTIPLLVLSHTRFGRDDMTTTLKVAQTLVYMFLVNVPLFIIRLILWHVRNQNISVFIVKNVLGKFTKL